MYKRLLIVTFTLIGLCTILTLLPIHGEDEIYDNVLRLHVLANSDSDEDQALKIRVRDELLEATEDIFADCKTREDAERLVRENMSLIRNTAQNAVSSAGYSYPVSIAFDEEEYPTRNYENACFPAGEYMSLRVMIGEAEGQNWWCVLFPPMCVGAASQSDTYAEVGLTGGQYNIITETDKPTYKVRFKLLEAIDQAVNNS